MIREIFWRVDAERILKIPLAIGMMEDFVSWHFYKNGVYSVTSRLYMRWAGNYSKVGVEQEIILH
jgi:hypothetical protein